MIDLKDFQVGQNVLRLEDRNLLMGRARFVDDVPIHPVLHACFVRSVHAHAKILGVDMQAARKLAGVHGVFAAADLFGEMTEWRMPLGFHLSPLPEDTVPFVLATDEVAYVGEAIAVVVADSRHIAEDAAALVKIEYEPLPSVIDCRAALEDNAPLVRTERSSNLLADYKVEYGDVERFKDDAYLSVSGRFWTHRGTAHSIEGRGVLARLDEGTGILDVWSSTQMSHALKYTLTLMLDQPEDRVEVHVPDVGGGFGGKFMVYPEEVVIPLVARKLRKPVKWIDDRRENFLSSIQERDQYWKAELIFDRDAKIHALNAELMHDNGAYTPQGLNVPYNGASSLSGQYIIPNLRVHVKVAYTNKVMIATIRGAGYPQAAFVMERMMDKMAQKLNLSRLVVRERNMIPAEKMPYEKPIKSRAGEPLVIDSGDYHDLQRTAAEHIDWNGFEKRKKETEARGLLRGIGLANSVKPTGRGPFEAATVAVHPSGRISIYSAALPMGQGIATTLAQICAEVLRVHPSGIDVHTGDTRFIKYGIGGFSSRQTMMAGSAVHEAAIKVRDKALQVAARVLGVAEGDLHFEWGDIWSRTDETKRISLARVSMLCKGSPGYKLPMRTDPGLESMVSFSCDAQAFAGGSHACEVEVDPETGGVQIVRYVAVQDCGRVVNPQTAKGQVMGGVAHGIGNALFEHMVFDQETGQPLSTTCAEYIIPTAPCLPDIEVVFRPSLTNLNPMGIKGVGETANLAVMPAVISAVENALEAYRVEINEFPLSPMRLVELIEQAAIAKKNDEPAGVPMKLVELINQGAP